MVISYNMSSHFKVLEYFDRYPLYSSKYLAYKDWKKVVNEIKIRDGKPLTNESILNIIKIKPQFYNNRKVYDFTHLDSLNIICF